MDLGRGLRAVQVGRVAWARRSRLDATASPRTGVSPAAGPVPRPGARAEGGPIALLPSTVVAPAAVPDRAARPFPTSPRLPGATRLAVVAAPSDPGP